MVHFFSPMPDAGEITTLLNGVHSGDPEAMARLIPIVYAELRRLAGHYMNKERPGHTLQATALVNEAFLRLVGLESQNWQNRTHFFSVASHIMRNLLVDHARARHREKRRAGVPVSLDVAATLAIIGDGNVVAVDNALSELAKAAPRPAQIVELRYFGGLSQEEIAGLLGISERTVRREWQMAKAWLYSEIRRDK